MRPPIRSTALGPSGEDQASTTTPTQPARCASKTPTGAPERPPPQPPRNQGAERHRGVKKTRPLCAAATACSTLQPAPAHLQQHPPPAPRAGAAKPRAGARRWSGAHSRWKPPTAERAAARLARRRGISPIGTTASLAVFRVARFQAVGKRVEKGEERITSLPAS